jgi:hypothetical protein
LGVVKLPYKNDHRWCSTAMNARAIEVIEVTTVWIDTANQGFLEEEEEELALKLER